MKILLVTEKCSANELELDGGARLVHTLCNKFGESLSIMQFGPEPNAAASWYYEYPIQSSDRFTRRLANADFIAEKIKSVQTEFTHVFFIHIAMQFGIVNNPLSKEVQVWTFPMFLTPSYLASGETVPENYFKAERMCILNAPNIITPSHLEKRQLIDFYSVPKERIHVVPRGIDTSILAFRQRSISGAPKFCSIGSIKPQKNTIGLIILFAEILKKYPDATLQIIGPIQNSNYYEEVEFEINRLGLKNSVEIAGYIPPQRLPTAIADAHIHISASTCETFGRAIFETLASGLPNVARSRNNAAAEYLAQLPYACFTDEIEEAVKAIDRMLLNLPALSGMAQEIGQFYNESILSALLIAKICGKETIAISDFDGTLYHKDDPAKTLQSIKAFQSYGTKILCSARPIHELLEKVQAFGIAVDWIVGCSGAIVADGSGKKLWHVPLDPKDVLHLETLMPRIKRIEMEGDILQLAVSTDAITVHPGLRTENYQGIVYISHWEASKFRAVHRLLRHINWSGRVSAFGDGPYDAEFLNYFDGIYMTNDTIFQPYQKEGALHD